MKAITDFDAALMDLPEYLVHEVRSLFRAYWHGYLSPEEEQQMEDEYLGDTIDRELPDGVLD